MIVTDANVVSYLLAGDKSRGILLTLNLLQDVIPSVAEESKNLEIESTAGILDSSATLGMT